MPPARAGPRLGCLDDRSPPLVRFARSCHRPIPMAHRGGVDHRHRRARPSDSRESRASRRAAIPSSSQPRNRACRPAGWPTRSPAPPRRRRCWSRPTRRADSRRTRTPWSPGSSRPWPTCPGWPASSDQGPSPDGRARQAVITLELPPGDTSPTAVRTIAEIRRTFAADGGAHGLAVHLTGRGRPGRGPAVPAVEDPEDHRDPLGRLHPAPAASSPSVPCSPRSWPCCRPASR